MNAWRDVRSIWRVSVNGRSAQASQWLNGLALVALVAGLIARLIDLMPATVFPRFAVGVAGAWLLMVWTMLFIPASVLMNSASNARLVPRQRRRLLQMAAGCWALVVGAFIFVSGSWRYFPLIAAYMLGMGLVRVGVRPAMVLLVLTLNWPLLMQRVLPEPALQFMTSTPGLVLTSALVVLASAWVLQWLYPAGGDRHLAGHRKVTAMLRRQEPRDTAKQQGSAWSNRLVYGPALRRACRGRRPDAMLMHALGPAGHWTAWVASVGVLLAIGLGLHLVPLLFGRPVPRGASDWLLGFGMSTSAFLVAFATVHLTQQMRKTAGEQALLRLTPLAGDTALLNRRLAAGMLKGALASWGLVTAAILLWAWLIGADGSVLVEYASVCCLGGQLAMSGLLGDLARTMPVYDWERFIKLGLQAGANLLLAYGLSLLGGVFAVWLALVTTLGAVWLLLLDRRRMLAAGPAFPVERLV